MSYLPGYLDRYLERPYTQAAEEPPRELAARKHTPLAPGEERRTPTFLHGESATIITAYESRPCPCCHLLARTWLNRRGVTVCLSCAALPEAPL